MKFHRFMSGPIIRHLIPDSLGGFLFLAIYWYQKQTEVEQIIFKLGEDSLDLMVDLGTPEIVNARSQNKGTSGVFRV